MQSRRHEDFTSQSSFVRDRRNTDLGPDSYLMVPPYTKRSWSPRRVEGASYSERVLGGHRRSASLERRRIAGDGSRRIRSRSPPFMEAKRDPFCNDDWVIDRDLPTPERVLRCEFFDHMDMNCDDVDSRMRNEFSYTRGSSRAAITDDKFEGRRLDSGMSETGSQKPSVMGVLRSKGDVGLTSRIRGSFSSASANMGLSPLQKERVQYPDVRDSLSFDKYTNMKQFGEGEKDIVRLRDAPYFNFTAPRSKESMGASHFKDYPRTSPRNSRFNHLGYRPLPQDNHPINSSNIMEPLSHSSYGQRQHLDLSIDSDLDINEDMSRYTRETFGSRRTGHGDSLHQQPRVRESDDYMYPSDDFYENTYLRERVDYSDRDMIRPNLLDNVTQHAESSDFARGNMKNRSSWDHRSPEKLTSANNIRLSRSSAEKREGGQYLDTASVHSQLGRKISREKEMPYMGMVQDHEIARSREDYEFKRDVGTGSHKERMRSSPGFLYDRERLRLAEATHKMEGRDLSSYDSSGRFLKRKYTVDKEENRISSRTMMSRLGTVSRRHNQDFRDEEWIDQDARGSTFTKRRDHANGLSRRVDKPYYGTDPISEEWFLSHDSDELMHDHRMKLYEYEDKYAKGYSRSSARGGYNSYHPNRRHALPKQNNVSIRSDENDDEADMYSGEFEQYEAWASSTKLEPPEDSEEFKQLVHDFFLSFTKKLNDTPGVQRRYLEQGRAGSLFCIVCSRSLSKEFLDTQRLATHAFMSRKVGMRAQHLGLHKAICVLLGWNSTIHRESITWYPEILSSTESLAQKEDLVLWPPVVIIHNTSIANNNPNCQGPTTVEALGQFLRGKGLNGGKVKLGKPANCSIMLVKFLGTFSGLQDAERIHQYFAKNKHGRTELKQITSSKGKGKDSSSCGDGENENGDEEVERVLFGYMGVAEDLVNVDFDTKRKCSIKSKKEIQELADAPVKPE